LQVVFAFYFDFLDPVNHDVRLGHVDEGHCQADVPVYEAVIPVVEGLS